MVQRNRDRGLVRVPERGDAVGQHFRQVRVVGTQGRAEAELEKNPKNRWHLGFDTRSPAIIP